MKAKRCLLIDTDKDKQFLDEDDNVILLYNQHKWRLTFYADEELKLGYIITSNPEQDKLIF